MNSKAYMNAVGARLLTDWTNRLPAQLTALGFRAAAAAGLLSSGKPVFNTIVTNVPGPQVPLYFAGARLVRSFGAGPCVDGMGLFQVVSLADDLRKDVLAPLTADSAPVEAE